MYSSATLTPYQGYKPIQLMRLSLVVLILMSTVGWSIMTVRYAQNWNVTSTTSSSLASPTQSQSSFSAFTVSLAQSAANLWDKTSLTSARASSLAPVPNAGQIASSADLPAGLYSSMIHQEQAEGGQVYNLQSSVHPSLVEWLATNPAQNFSLNFGTSEVKINNWGLNLTSLESDTSVQLQLARTEANRIEYQHSNGLTEWYVNGPLGLEQGFTLSHSLPQTSSDGWLSLPVSFEGVKVQTFSQSSQEWLKLVGPSGEAVGQYGKLYASDATGQKLDSQLEAAPGGQGAILRIKLAGASYPVVIDPFVQQAKLIPSQAAIAGYSISLSNDKNTALVSSPNEQSMQGAAYIFTRSGTSWSQQARFTASDGASSDRFGEFVYLSGDGNTAIVGSDSKNSQGAAYIFTRSGTSWSQQAEITASDGASNNYFGSALALNGDGSTAIVGAYGKKAAYVFTRSGTSWSQQAELVPSDNTTNNYFGFSVALSADGNIALIGADLANATQGAAYIFTRSGTSWTQQTKLTASDATNSSTFGDAVALSADGNTALIGAYQKTIGSNQSEGVAYIFTYSGTSWSQQAELISSDGAAQDNFGSSVSLSADGNTAAIGAFHKVINSHNYQGSVYVFTYSGTSWSQQTELISSDGSSYDDFGQSVSLSGDGSTLLIGAPGHNGGQGAAYTFVVVAASTTTLTSSPNPSTIGQSVTFTATVNSITATGSIKFTFNTGATVSTTLSGGIATYITNTLPVGSRVITATYGGDSNYAGSNSNTVTQVVNLNSSSLSLSSSPNPSTVGQSVIFTATVSPTNASGIYLHRWCNGAGNRYSIRWGSYFQQQ